MSKIKPFRKITPVKFEVYYNDEDYVLLIKPTHIYGERTFHVITETAYSETSYELLSDYQIKKKYGIKL